MKKNNFTLPKVMKGIFVPGIILSSLGFLLFSIGSNGQQLSAAEVRTVNILRENATDNTPEIIEAQALINDTAILLERSRANILTEVQSSGYNNTNGRLSANVNAQIDLMGQALRRINNNSTAAGSSFALGSQVNFLVRYNSVGDTITNVLQDNIDNNVSLFASGLPIFIIGTMSALSSFAYFIATTKKDKIDNIKNKMLRKQQ